jgi:hypothetical protein
MKKTGNNNVKSTNGKRLSPKTVATLAAAAVASGTVGTALALSGAKATTLGFIIFPH